MFSVNIQNKTVVANQERIALKENICLGIQKEARLVCDRISE